MAYKLLHATFLSSPLSGILQQLRTEFEAVKKLDITWVTKAWGEFQTDYSKYPFYEKISNSSLIHTSKQFYFAQLQKYSADFDFILFRYIPHCFSTLSFLIKCQKPVLSVHHTIEPNELKCKSNFGRTKFFLDYIIGKVVLNYVSGIVAVTPEIGEFQRKRIKNRDIPVFIYPNGTSQFKPTLDCRGQIPNFLFIATNLTTPWQGFDLIFNGIKLSDQEFVVHAVGEADSDFISKHQDPRIIFHGKLTENEIWQLASKCDLGFGGMAIFRKNLNQACSLKVREYLALGLPVYTNHNDVFPSNFPFFRNGQINFSCILKYSNDMKSFSRQKVCETSRAFIEKEMLVKNLYESFDNIFTKQQKISR